MTYTEINDFDIAIKMWRLDGEVDPRQLSVFCHAAWFENRNMMVNPVPGMVCYYTEKGVSLLTDLAISHAIAKDHTIIPVKEVVVKGGETYDYSLRANENNEEVEAYWQAAAGSAEVGEEPADILLVTGDKNIDADRKSDRYYLLSEVFAALDKKGFSYELIRFYACREIQQD